MDILYKEINQKNKNSSILDNLRKVNFFNKMRPATKEELNVFNRVKKNLIDVKVQKKNQFIKISDFKWTGHTQPKHAVTVDGSSDGSILLEDNSVKITVLDDASTLMPERALFESLKNDNNSKIRLDKLKLLLIYIEGKRPFYSEPSNRAFIRTLIKHIAIAENECLLDNVLEMQDYKKPVEETEQLGFKEYSWKELLEKAFGTTDYKKYGNRFRKCLKRSSLWEKEIRPKPRSRKLIAKPSVITKIQNLIKDPTLSDK